MKVCENLFEKEAWSEHKPLVGIDEAGRGPLAGPLVVAGVVFPIGYENPKIYDSKAISEKKRNRLFDEILAFASWYKILEIPVEVIDELNIYQATKRAMMDIAKEAPCDIVLTDAMPLQMEKRVEALVKGDQKSFSIAAASILAKVTRDRIMVQLDQQYPGYDLAKNKGYPTKVHCSALEEIGISPCHRLSYGPVKKIVEKK